MQAGVDQEWLHSHGDLEVETWCEGESPESTWRDNATGQSKGPKAKGCLVHLQKFIEAHVVKQSKQEAE